MCESMTTQRSTLGRHALDHGFSSAFLRFCVASEGPAIHIKFAKDVFTRGASGLNLLVVSSIHLTTVLYSRAAEPRIPQNVSAKETVCRSADSRTHDNCVTGIYVICGDACAYKGHAHHSTDAGTRRGPDLGAIGLVASAIGATILF